ncbi:hypothetical protein [Mitsuaria sp. 7]|uniref:hypothetical protein n=1 Tax=Mitsuaria sp. 7 TaxID=1658665 RepID=UPI0007DCF92D|nr:hypothetical protein [Mitsuaria sp. 7]ANH67612.1 hypothetical protein ABE85_08610 [Mitsuaria sp. 7]
MAMISAALTSLAFCLVIAALVGAVRSLFPIGRGFSLDMSRLLSTHSSAKGDVGDIAKLDERQRRERIGFLKSGAVFVLLVGTAALILLLRNWLVAD